MINPAEIPTLENVDADALITAGKKIRQAGDGVRDAGADVYKAWQGLAQVYEAPEAATLLSAMAPVKAKAATFNTKAGKSGAALVTYGTTVGPIKKKLASLKAEATAFVERMKALGEEWRADPANVEEDRRLQREVSKAVREFMEAEEDCAKAINAASGAAAPAPRQKPQPGQATDWGTPEQADLPWYQDVWNAVAGFGGGFAVDGAGGAIVGLGVMVGLGEEGDFGRAMLGLADLGALLGPGAGALPDVGHLAIGDAAKGVPTSRNERLLMMGKGFLAWDKWKTDPARAAGEAAFNVITLPFIGTKIGTAGKFGNLAAATNKTTAAAARVSTTVDVPAHIIRGGMKGAGLAVKGIGDFGKAGKFPGLGNLGKIPDMGKMDTPVESGKPSMGHPDGPHTAKSPGHADGGLPTKGDSATEPLTVREVDQQIDEIGKAQKPSLATRDANTETGAPDTSAPRTGSDPVPRSTLRFDTTSPNGPPNARGAGHSHRLEDGTFHPERFRTRPGTREFEPVRKGSTSFDEKVDSTSGREPDPRQPSADSRPPRDADAHGVDDGPLRPAKDPHAEGPGQIAEGNHAKSPTTEGYDDNLLSAAADPSVDISKITPEPIWRTDHEPLYRLDNRELDIIFEDGFHPKGEATDLVAYTQGNVPSIYVSTTVRSDLFKDPSWGMPGYMYKIDAPHGIDVNRTLNPEDNIFPSESEIAFPGGIDRNFVVGGWEIIRNADGTRTATGWRSNPKYTNNDVESGGP